MRLLRLCFVAATALLVSVVLVPLSPLGAQTEDTEPKKCRANRVNCVFGGTSPDAVESGANNTFPAEVGGPTTITTSTGPSFLDGCTFELLPAGEPLVTGGIGDAAVNDGSVFEVDYWVVFCGPAGIGAYTFYPDGGAPPAPIIGDMIQDAYARTPVVAFNPITSPDGDDNIPLVTQLITFLWVDETAWNAPVSATASIPGFDVTTTATPTLATWSGGDQKATCTGDEMVPYQFGIGGDDAQPSNCTTVFKQSSAVANHEIELAVTWTTEYTCTDDVCGGPLPDLITNSTRPVTVAEIQAVATNTP